MADLVAPTPTGRSKGSAANALAAKKGNTAPSTDFDFNLGATKAKVLKLLDETVPTLFRKFYNSQLFDRLLQTCLLYFTAMFQHEWVVAAMDKSRKQHLDGYNPYVVAQRIRELQAEVNALRLEISPIYSMLILKFSSYEKPQQDRKFFEALYESLICIMDDAFERLKKRPEIEQELGQLFRSKHFNMYTRKHQPPRSVDTLSVKELYALKNETHNRALNARMLASLFEKPATLGVTVASVTHSPLVTQYVMSPVIARSMMKDPQQRDLIIQTRIKQSEPQTEQAAHQEKRRQIGNVFRSAAMLHGVNPDKLASNMVAGKMKAGDLSDVGIVGADRARRSDVKNTPLMAPEAVGLPADDQFNYLMLMKRYVMFGPSLGLNNPAGGAPGAPGGASGTASTNPHASGVLPTSSGAFAAAATGATTHRASPL